MGFTNFKNWTAYVKLTAAELNEQIRDNGNYLKTTFALEEATELTIDGGEILRTKTNHSVDTEGDAATDNLDTINGGNEGDIIILRAANSARTVILKNGTGNLDLGGDIYLTDINQHVALLHNGTNWVPIWIHNIVREFTVNAFQYPAPGTDWTPQLEGAGLVASKTAKKCWLPLNFLKEGDAILSYKLVGDATEVTALTLDCKLVRINKANPLTTTDIPGGGITQITADGNFDSEAILTDPEIIATDKQYVLEINGTTDSDDSIIVIGAEIKIIRLD